MGTIMQQWWYSHRFRDADPAKQAANLRRARERFNALRTEWATSHPDRVLVAWWLDMAESGRDESDAWWVIDTAIRTCDGLVMDLDGGDASPGMLREQDIARNLLVEVLP